VIFLKFQCEVCFIACIKQHKCVTGVCTLFETQHNYTCMNCVKHEYKCIPNEVYQHQQIQQQRSRG